MDNTQAIRKCQRRIRALSFAMRAQKTERQVKELGFKIGRVMQEIADLKKAAQA